MAHAAIPLLVGTGIQIIGARQGWDPRLTAFASIAAGGIGAGMASGAFSGAAAAVPGVAQAATTGVSSSMVPTATGAIWNPTTVGQGLASSAVPSAASSAIPSAASFAVPGGEAGRVLGGMNYAQNISPSYIPAGPGAGYYGSTPRPAVDSVAGTPAKKAPFFDRNQYEWETKAYTKADGTPGLQRSKVQVFDDAGNPVQGMSAADSLGISMADTFLQYELALAQQPPPRPVQSGGGGGGSGGPMAPAYNGGGGSGQKQVTWGFGGGNNNGYQPQGLV